MPWGNTLATELCLVCRSHSRIEEFTNACLDSGNIVRLTVSNSSDLDDAANWSDHQLFVVQRHDSEPRSAYPYNSADPANPVVDFNKFFDGESLDQEDLVL